MSKKFLNIVICPNCNGAGEFEQYKHIAEGICFKCNGDCVVEEWSDIQLPPVSKAEARSLYLASLQCGTELDKEIAEIHGKIKVLEEKQRNNLGTIKTFEESKEKCKDLPAVTQLNLLYDSQIGLAKVAFDQNEKELLLLKDEFEKKVNQRAEFRRVTRK